MGVEEKISHKRGPVEVFRPDAYIDEKEMNEYLKLCDFIMCDANPQCCGLLLRGSSQYNERAIKLLA